MKEAAFIMCRYEDGWAGTTRPDGGVGGVGLPGGKVDAGETPYDAACREAIEEGWLPLEVGKEPFYSTVCSGGDLLVHWFSAKHMLPLVSYKEQGRIMAVKISTKQLRDSSMNNDIALARLSSYEMPKKKRQRDRSR
jgi:hypothetical protein